jgi:ABC-type transporter Mla MlaB component
MMQDVAVAGRLVLDGVLTMRTAEAVCTLLREAVAAQPAVSIDCTAATDVDLSFIQLLLAARVSALQSNKTVTLMAAPDGPLLGALSRAGFRVTQEDRSGQSPSFWFEGMAA